MKIVINDEQDNKSTLGPNDIKKNLLNLETQGINVELLKRGLCAHIFDQHVIKKSLIETEIHINQKRKHSSIALAKIKEFLKKDLVVMKGGGKGGGGYGVKYEIVQGTLYFSGVVEEEFIDKTIVIQFMTHRGRILKEVHISGDWDLDNDSIPIIEEAL